MYSDGDYDIITREFPSLEQGHLDQSKKCLVHFKVQHLRGGCNEVVETGMVLQPLRAHHFVV